MKAASRIFIGLFAFLALAAIFLALSESRLQAQTATSSPDQASPVFVASDPVTPQLSQPVRDMAAGSGEKTLYREINPLRNPHLFSPDLGLPGSNTTGLDALAANSVNNGRTPSPLFTFEGVSSLDGVTPPDTNGDVGPNHYVQMTNFHFAIYDKTGALLSGPTPLSTLFTGTPNCAVDNGDPVVVYDELADRWLLSQFSISGTPQYMCIAISQTPDPTGAYYLYQFATPDFPDYFKFGVWPDAYYMTTNTGFPNAYYAYAFDRVSMLAGAAATFQAFGGFPNFMMPADLDGDTPPPAGTPGYFYTFLDAEYPDHPVNDDLIRMYEFDVDWATPGNTTFTELADYLVTPFNYTVCGFFVQTCIPQPGTGQTLDSLSYWPMFRFAYRNLSNYEAMVGNFTVDLDGSDKAAIRWFELRRTGAGAWGLEQEGTYAPDGDHRWMGSIAMDGSGNIALGYSVSSNTTIPSIRYATRLRTDSPGTLQAEATMYAGTGVQTGIYRWGDYSAMSVDPVDDCTFWFTTEYHDVDDSGWGWNTRVGTFRLPECTGALFPDFYLSATPTEQSICTPSTAPYAITVGQVMGYTDPVTLSASGHPAGTTATFSTNPVTPPGSSTMTIGNTGAAAAGSYDIEVMGVAPTSTHTTTVGLNVFTTVPGTVTLISPSDGATNINLSPTLVWGSATQGESYTVEVADDAGFTNIVYAASVDITSETLSIALSPLTTYYWRVTPDNSCGAGSASATFSFTTADIPPILLVDDDNNSPDVLSYYTDALDALGADYDIWDTGGSDNEPTAVELAPYDAVIWFTGVSFGGSAGPGASSEAALGTWLDDGGCFFISAQDYYYDRGFTPFIDNYLGAASVTSDVGQTTVTGAGSVFSGLGPYSLVYPFTNYSDLVIPDGSPAELAFSGSAGDAAVDKDSGVYRTTFWGFPFEAIPTATDREASMQTVLNWCGALGPTGTLEGTVTDADSSLGIEGATVTAVGPGTFSTFTDANGFYDMTLPIGTYDVTASADNYVPETVTNIDIITNTTETQDFQLQGSALTYSPPEIEETMEIGDVVTNTVTVTNTGPLPIDWSVNIGNYGGPLLAITNHSVRPINPTFDQPTTLVEKGQEGAMNTAGLELPQPAIATPLAAGDVLDSWAVSGLPFSWGIAMDGTDVWVSSPASSWGGNNSLNQYALDGTPGGVSHPYTWNPANGPADVTYNWNTGMLWVMDVAQDDCIHEVDPSSGVTGNTICPAFGTSERGLAYDPATDTYLAGGWNDLTIFRFAPDGTILEQVSVGLSIAGLAYNPDSMHLFVMVNASPNSVYVLDAADNYNVVGQFSVSEGFGDYSGAGLEIDCVGNLWAVDQTVNTAYLFESGESASLCSGGASWASAVPDSGTIPANSTATFDVVFDARSMYQTGDFTAELTFDGTFVNVVPTMPLTMHLGCPTCGFLAGDITDSITGDPVDASIHVTSTNGFDATVNGSSYSLAVQPGTYNFTVEAGGYLGETATAVVTAGNTTTTDFELDPAVAYLEYSPSEIEEWMEIGDIVTNTVTVTNDGFVDLDFTVDIGGYGGPLLVQQVVPAYVPPTAATGTAHSLQQLATGKANNLLGTRAASSAPDMAVLLDQQPNGVNGLFSDSGCGLCGTGAQSIAENFSLASSETIGQIIFWTGYYPGDVPIDPDLITVIFHEDSGGFPGTAVSTEANVPYERVQTGVVLFGVHEWMHTLTLDTPVTLGPGNYWVEIFNDTASSSENFFWETGNPDTIGNGLTGSVWSTSVPGSGWNYDGATELAVQLVTGSGGVQWASAVPDSGTVPAGSSATFDVVFDARSMYQVGDFTAELTFDGNFVNVVPTMPLTMHLSCPTCGFLAGDITDSITGDPVDASVHVTSTNGFDATVSGSSYSLAVQPGTYNLMVEADGYLGETATAVVTAGNTTTTNFELDPAVAYLEYSPPTIERTVVYSGVVTTTVTVTNDGFVDLDFTVRIGNFGGPALAITNHSVRPINPTFDQPTTLVEKGQEGAMNTAGLELPQPAIATPLAAGDVLDSWAVSGLPFSWGIAMDGTDVWVSSPASSWGGNNSLNQYALDGTPGGVSHSYTWNPANGPADVTYNWNTGMLWVMDVAQDDCIHEVDPSSGVTGNTICPAFGTSERGLAYDPATDTYLAGGWNDATIFRFAPDGTILEQVNVGLPIAGLAYNPDTAHLFVMVNGSPNSVYVLDAANNYAVVGQFSVSEGFGDYSGAGLEIDCDGNLWAVDQTSNTAYLFESGESVSLCGIPWAYAVPNAGTIPPNSTGTFDVVFDARLVDQLGTYTADLSFGGNFVNIAPTMPLTMHVVTETYGLELTGDMAASGAPDEMVMYTLHITNTGNVPDTYDLTLGTHVWTTELPDGNSVTLEAGEATTIVVHVTIPADAEDNDMDMVTVTATSSTDNTLTASVDLTTTAVVPPLPTYTLFLPVIFKP